MQKCVYRLVDSRSAEITKGEFFLTGLGTFHFALTLPDNVRGLASIATHSPQKTCLTSFSVFVKHQINLGDAGIHIHLEEHENQQKYEHVHRFQVQEVRRPSPLNG
jgi:hypothetical protein